MAKDLYSVLGVPRDASKDDIKKAYQSMAMRYHPDRNKEADAEERFKEVRNAYAVLSDEQKRSAYDQYGEASLNGNAQQFDSSSFHDIFDSLFGENMGRGFSPFGNWGSDFDNRRGRDLQANVAIGLEEAFTGCEKKLRISAMFPCDGCKGTGMGKDTKRTACKKCDGSGAAVHQLGPVSMQSTCRACGGTGYQLVNPCKGCSGTGKSRKTREIDVNIPAGVDTNDILRIKGKGEISQAGGEPGDLLITISINRHELFDREGENLRCDLPVMLTTAILGGKVRIPTMEGHVDYDLPKGTQSGTVLRLAGKGIKGARSGKRGDLLVRINLETPTNLTGEQTKLVKQIHKSLQANPAKHSPKQEGWVQRAKKLFS